MKTGYDAYGATHKQTLKGRPLEAEAFIKSVTLLKKAQDFPGNKRFLVDALNYTRRLWMIVQADLNSPANKHSDDLKAKLLSLSLFVDKQCLELIEKPHQHHMLQGLIDVNQNVAGGLLD